MFAANVDFLKRLFPQMSQLLTIVDGAVKVAKTLEKVEDINRALEKVKAGLHTVKVSQHDATKVQREIEGELFDKWHEGCEVENIIVLLHYIVFYWFISTANRELRLLSKTLHS